MTKVNIASRRTKADDDKALAAKEQSETGEGRKIVTEGTKKFIVEKTASGMVIKTRIA